jgi:hypothetical protein
MRASQVEEIELDLLCEAILRRWGDDFRHDARASLRRRFKGFMRRIFKKVPIASPSA